MRTHLVGQEKMWETVEEIASSRSKNGLVETNLTNRCLDVGKYYSDRGEADSTLETAERALEAYSVCCGTIIPL